MPGGTQSSVLSAGLEAGASVTLRSNGTVYSDILQDEEGITIPDPAGGAAVVNESSAVPTDIQTAAGAVQGQAENGDSYTTESLPIACLYDHSGFEVGGRQIPPSLSLPCHSPVIGELDAVTQGSTVANPSPPPEELAIPITLTDGEYRLLGSVGGDQSQIESISVSEEVAQTE
jgi:hypothetical protein